MEINGVDLVRERIDKGDVEGVQGIKLVSEFYAVSFEAKKQCFCGS